MNAASLLRCSGLVVAIAGVARGDAPSARLSADDVRATVAQMVADAETRSSLLADAGAAGHDGKGFFLASPDGAFRLVVRGQAQFRYTAVFRDADPGDPDNDVPAIDDYEGGFTTPRTRLYFSGHIFEPALIYQVNGEFSRTSGDFVLQDAYAGYVFENGLTVLWGQLRMPVLYEDMLKDQKGLAVDESVVNAVFRQDRSQGVWLHRQAKDYRFWVGFSDGIRSQNTDLEDPAEADWALTGRFEWKFAGDWADMWQFSSGRGSELNAKVGVAAHYQENENAPGVERVRLFAYSADALVQGDGWNAFAEFVGLNSDADGSGSMDDFGVVLQAGVFVSENVEPFARYDVVVPDSDRAGDDAFNTITVGLNYYLHGQAAKFTLDGQWFLDATEDNDLVHGIASSARGRGIGLLPSREEDAVAVRAQFQLLF